MRTDHKPDGGRSASLSRRNFLQIAAAGTAATLPAVAEAGPDRQLGELVPLTDEQQLDACIEELKAILKRMHPGFATVDGARAVHSDGGSSVFITVWMPPRPLVRKLEGGAPC